ncbi:tetratricopeptide (TPR) repeat protein [Ereboglobus sp. PH5-5]|uniref:tetratricopeptide repeat protein n=1 Tax=unclassified Ereboglobus TaxID=2626932 RepID=UPI0024062568|nr:MULTISPECIES: tetratricopeptide repeat protein [unclassified Ereboglobus]MDF9825935.1 tetratricopeptide (TPR) repeat protein [Ereboglobus sp. PH5-10]MDF9833304.1 tetratricopeptide (TPR) repeat protein [Ereboglobus sp. PH5-5]
MKSSNNPADYTEAELRGEIERGARLVVYSYCVSFLVVTLRRSTRAYLIHPGAGGFGCALPWVLVSLLFGWWGFPWGIIYTPAALWRTISGGTDLTDDWRKYYDESLRAGRAANLSPSEQQQPAPSSFNRPQPAAPMPTQFGPDSSTPASFRDDAQHTSRPSPVFVAFRLAAVLCVFVLAVYVCLGFWTMNTTRTVTLVNGLGVSYKVAFNDASHECPAAAGEGAPVKHIELPGGRYEVRAELPGVSQAFTATIHVGPASIWTWPGGLHRAVIINPDRLAIVYRERITYTARTASGKDGDDAPNPIELFVNEGVYDIRKPDYYFTDAPSALRLKKGSNSTRTHLDVVRGMSLMGAGDLIHKFCTPEALADYAANASLVYGVSAVDVLFNIATQMKPDEMRRLFERHIDARPVNVQWHRHYQSCMEIGFPDVDLVAGYRARLTANPQNGAYSYLLARVISDDDEARELYEKALTAPEEPCAFAWNGLGFLALRNGDHARALDCFEKSAAKDEQNDRNVERLNLLVALNRPDDALALANKWALASPKRMNHAVDAMLMLGVCKRPSTEATRMLIAFDDAFGSKMTRDIRAEFRALLESSYAYGMGDENRYLALIRPNQQGGGQALNYALSRGDHVAVAKIQDSLDDPLAHVWFLAAIVAHHGNDAASADAYYAKGIDSLRRADRRGRVLADILESSREAPPSIVAVMKGTGRSCEDRIIFCLLGFRHPSHRDAFWNEAKVRNYAPSFPHLLLKRAMAQ